MKSYRCILGNLVIGVLVLLGCCGLSFAQSKCTAQNWKMLGKHVGCLGKAYVRSEKSGIEVLPTDVAICSQKGNELCVAAETNGDCQYLATCLVLLTSEEQHTEAAFYYASQDLDGSKCDGKKMKAFIKGARCLARLKAKFWSCAGVGCILLVADEDKCFGKFNVACAKAEGSFDCDTPGMCEDVRQELEQWYYDGDQ